MGTPLERAREDLEAMDEVHLQFKDNPLMLLVIQITRRRLEAKIKELEDQN